MMQFWFGLIIGCMVGSLVGIAFLSLVIVGKEADERMVGVEGKGFEEEVWMREIKFRAWGKDMGLMFDVFGFDVNHIHGWLRTDKEKINLAIPPHRRDCELMQFTGRKDINGVEIYESDLVKYGNKTLEVIWNPIGSGSWWYAEAGRKHVRRIDLDELEVIGNIYEHPHLLEDKS